MMKGLADLKNFDTYRDLKESKVFEIESERSFAESIGAGAIRQDTATLEMTQSSLVHSKEFSNGNQVFGKVINTMNNEVKVNNSNKTQKMSVNNSQFLVTISELRMPTNEDREVTESNQLLQNYERIKEREQAFKSKEGLHILEKYMNDQSKEASDSQMNLLSSNNNLSRNSLQMTGGMQRAAATEVALTQRKFEDSQIKLNDSIRGDYYLREVQNTEGNVGSGQVPYLADKYMSEQSPSCDIDSDISPRESAPSLKPFNSKGLTNKRETIQKELQFKGMAQTGQRLAWEVKENSQNDEEEEVFFQVTDEKSESEYRCKSMTPRKLKNSDEDSRMNLIFSKFGLHKNNVQDSFFEEGDDKSQNQGHSLFRSPTTKQIINLNRSTINGRLKQNQSALPSQIRQTRNLQKQKHQLKPEVSEIKPIQNLINSSQYVSQKQKMTLNMIKYNEMLHNIVSERKRNLIRQDTSQHSINKTFNKKNKSPIQLHEKSSNNSLESFTGTIRNGKLSNFSKISPIGKSSKHAYQRQSDSKSRERAIQMNQVKTAQINIEGVGGKRKEYKEKLIGEQHLFVIKNKEQYKFSEEEEYSGKTDAIANLIKTVEQNDQEIELQKQLRTSEINKFNKCQEHYQYILHQINKNVSPFDGPSQNNQTSQTSFNCSYSSQSHYVQDPIINRPLSSSSNSFSLNLQIKNQNQEDQKFLAKKYSNQVFNNAEIGPKGIAQGQLIEKQQLKPHAISMKGERPKQMDSSLQIQFQLSSNEQKIVIKTNQTPFKQKQSRNTVFQTPSTHKLSITKCRSPIEQSQLSLYLQKQSDTIDTPVKSMLDIKLNELRYHLDKDRDTERSSQCNQSYNRTQQSYNQLPGLRSTHLTTSRKDLIKNQSEQRFKINLESFTKQNQSQSELTRQKQTALKSRPSKGTTVSKDGYAARNLHKMKLKGKQTTTPNM